MAYILQVDFKMDGPFGEEMAAGFKGLAESINEEEGMLWKIWTVKRAVFTYLKQKKMLQLTLKCIQSV